MMDRFLVIIEKAEGNYGAYCPDVPGCVATAESYDEVERLMRESLRLHLGALREAGESVPEPSTQAEYVTA